MLEFVLVMVIVGTVLAMAAPSLRGFFASRRNVDAGSRMVALTRLARSRAVSEGRVYKLYLDAEAGTYRLGTGGRQGTDGPLGQSLGRTWRVPDGTRLYWETAEGAQTAGGIGFYPDGRKDQVVILLVDRGGGTVMVRCASALEPYEMTVTGEGGGS